MSENLRRLLKYLFAFKKGCFSWNSSLLCRIWSTQCDQQEFLNYASIESNVGFAWQLAFPYAWWRLVKACHTLSECQKGRVVKTTYQHFALDGRPCQNARWVVLTPCENSPFMSECIVALHRNGTLSALDGYIVTREFTHPVQHYHFDPEQSTLDTYICSQLNCGILTPNSTFTTRRCTHTQRGMFSPWMVWFLPADVLTEMVCVKVEWCLFIYHRWMNVCSKCFSSSGIA